MILSTLNTMIAMRTRRAATVLAAALAVLLSGLAPAAAQLKVDITQGNVDPLRIAVPDYIGQGDDQSGMERLGDDIATVIMADLDRSGLFAAVDQRAFFEPLKTIHEPPKFSNYRQINAKALVAGEVIALSDGRIQVNTRVWDVFANQQLASVAFKTPADNWRRAAHKVADFVYQTLTGEKGYFDTRLVFVHETGDRMRPVKRLMIMDQDGANPATLTDGVDYAALTPRFSPTQQQIIYLALFDDRPAQVYLFNIATGEQEALGSFDGMTFAPRFSPDGTGVMLSMERQGNSDIYSMDLRTRRLSRLTTTPAIDTSPTMSPDGRRIAFASDRGGSQQIYVMDADGANQRRITFGKGRYSTPVWSPRGDLIAFTRMHNGRFYIGVIRPDGSGERLLTESFLDEGPTWSPNGRVLMFFRQTPTRADGTGGGAALWSVDLTGHNLRRVRTPGHASDPAWSPLLP